MSVELHGYRYSVYLRIVAMTLTEKGVPWGHVEVDPFAQTIPESYLAFNPFGRVPTLVHDGFVLYETTAITRYVDEAFSSGPSLQPASAKERARMNQIIAVADSYGYWPMIRQVFSHRVFRPAEGRAGEETAVAEGVKRSATVLAALDKLAAGPFLAGATVSLADLHLGAMVAYFTAAEEGRTALSRHSKLSEWWAAFSKRPALLRTDPGLPST